MSRLKLASFADQFPSAMKEKVEKLATSIEQKAADAISSSLVEPVDVGRLKRSRGAKSTTRGISIGYTEVHAIPIDIGRVKSKMYRRTLKSGKKTVAFSRMLGSASRPEGMTRPALKEFRAVWESVVEDAGKDF